MLKIKQGVRMIDIKPAMVLAAHIIDEVYEDNGYICTVTSGNDGIHMHGSKHYSGEALDFSIKKIDGSIIDTAALQKMLADIKARLNECDYDTIIESDHIHCEYDPK